MKNTIEVDGVTYTRQASNGKRAVVVVDRGWIFAGDVTEKDGRILLSRALWIFRWESIGFAKMLEEPGSSKVDLRPVSDVDIPAASEVFRVPVNDSWGI